MPHGFTQCYLPPGRGDIPGLTPAEAGTRLSDPGGCKAELSSSTFSSSTVVVVVRSLIEKNFDKRKVHKRHTCSRQC